MAWGDQGGRGEARHVDRRQRFAKAHVVLDGGRRQQPHVAGELMYLSRGRLVRRGGRRGSGATREPY